MIKAKAERSAHIYGCLLPRAVPLDRENNCYPSWPSWVARLVRLAQNFTAAALLLQATRQSQFSSSNLVDKSRALSLSTVYN